MMAQVSIDLGAVVDGPVHEQELYPEGHVDRILGA
jgi:hypothetical protein